MKVFIFSVTFTSLLLLFLHLFYVSFYFSFYFSLFTSLFTPILLLYSLFIFLHILWDADSNRIYERVSSKTCSLFYNANGLQEQKELEKKLFNKTQNTSSTLFPSSLHRFLTLSTLCPLCPLFSSLFSLPLFLPLLLLSLSLSFLLSYFSDEIIAFDSCEYLRAMNPLFSSFSPPLHQLSSLPSPPLCHILIRYFLLLFYDIFL
jgi:hypothetical protein